MIFLKVEKNEPAAALLERLQRGRSDPSVADYIASDSTEGEETPLPGETPPVQAPQQRQSPPGEKPPPPPKPPGASGRIHWYLSKDSEGVLYVPTVMSKSEYGLLKAQSDSSLKVMLATSVVSDKEAENGDQS